MLSAGSAVAAVALVDEAVGDDGGTAAGMRKRGGIIGWSVGGWLAIVSRVVVGRWALGRLVGRLNGWLAGGLISGGWVSVSWLVGWLAVAHVKNGGGSGGEGFGRPMAEEVVGCQGSDSECTSSDGPGELPRFLV